MNDNEFKQLQSYLYNFPDTNLILVKDSSMICVMSNGKVVHNLKDKEITTHEDITQDDLSSLIELLSQIKTIKTENK